MKTAMVTKKKQRELFEKYDKMGDEWLNEENETKADFIEAQLDGMYTAIEMLGLEDAYLDWNAKHVVWSGEMSIFEILR